MHSYKTKVVSKTLYKFFITARFSLTLKAALFILPSCCESLGDGAHLRRFPPSYSYVNTLLLSLIASANIPSAVDLLWLCRASGSCQPLKKVSEGEMEMLRNCKLPRSTISSIHNSRMWTGRQSTHCGRCVHPAIQFPKLTRSLRKDSVSKRSLIYPSARNGLTRIFQARVLFSSKPLQI